MSAGASEPAGSQRPTSARAPHVLVVPYPSQGHMLPILDFAAALAGRGDLRVTVAVTTANVPLLAPLLSRNADIGVLSLPFPPVDPSILPAGVENAKDLPPSCFPGFIHALAGLHSPLAGWIKAQSLSSSPVTAVLSDISCGWTQPLATEMGIKRIVFSSSGAFGTAILQSLFRWMPVKSEDEEDALAFPSLPNSPEFKWRELSTLYRSCREGDPVSESVKKNFLWNFDSHGIALNTFMALEAPYLDPSPEDFGCKKLWAVGPIAMVHDGAGGRGGAVTVSAADVTAWLDKFGEGRAIYISFGSQANLGAAQSAALAAALEQCGAPFVWAMRSSTSLPAGFEARAAAGRQGLVIRGWAPQVAILRHPAVGWFVTHCGWNSVLEAVVVGVAMVAWPVTSDQFINARLLVDEVGVAVRAVGGSGAAQPEVAALAEVLRGAVYGSSGQKIRERVREVAAAAKAAVAEGGSSRRDADALVRELWDLTA